MKAGEVMLLLQISRSTLHRWAKEGLIRREKIGKINNQNFVQVPYWEIIQKIKYKAEEKGINVILQEESYTSKCSFPDNESIEYHSEYLEKRKGGLFRTAKCYVVNADVNGALNIIRKAIPDAFKGGRIGGCGLHPVRLIPHKAV